MYTIRRNKRAKTVSLSVYPDSRIVVTIPSSAADAVAEKFVEKKKEWIEKSLKHFSKFKYSSYSKLTKRDYKKHKEEARELVLKKLKLFNSLYKFEYSSVSLRNQKSRWGSASQKGSLSFNYKIMFLEEDLQDYIIVHELCHLKELNHSKRFWGLVSRAISDPVASRKKLGRLLI